MATKVTKTITYVQAMDRNICPACGSKHIKSVLTHHTKGWSTPACIECGYSAGGFGANSDGGIWVSFNIPHNVDTFEITHWEKTKLQHNLAELLIEADINLKEIECEYDGFFRDKLYELVKLIIDECGNQIEQHGHTLNDVRQHFGVR
jgi:hypothetical protein